MDLPEECILVAVHDGAGPTATWTLCVEDPEGNVVAYLAWPESWGDTITSTRLKELGYTIRVA